MIRATLVYLFIGLYVVLMAPIAVVWTLVTRDTAILYKMARLAIRIAGWMCRCGIKLGDGSSVPQQAQCTTCGTGYQTNSAGELSLASGDSIGKP